MDFSTIQQQATQYCDTKIGCWMLGGTTLSNVEIQKGQLRAFTVSAGSVLLHDGTTLSTGGTFGSPDPTYFYTSAIGLTSNTPISIAGGSNIIVIGSCSSQSMSSRTDKEREIARAEREAARAEREAARATRAAKTATRIAKEAAMIAKATSRVVKVDRMERTVALEDIRGSESTADWIRRMNAPYEDPDFSDLFRGTCLGGSVNNLHNLHCADGIIASGELREGTLKYRGQRYTAPGYFKDGVFFQQ